MFLRFTWINIPILSLEYLRVDVCPCTYNFDIVRCEAFRKVGDYKAPLGLAKSRSIKQRYKFNETEVSFDGLLSRFGSCLVCIIPVEHTVSITVGFPLVVALRR